MLDFLYTTDPTMKQTLASALRLVAVNPERPSKVYSGAWGCLAIAGQAYPSFDPIETDRYLMVVLGGPLPRHDFAIATGQARDDGSRWILDHWKAKQDLQWDEDLVGHFAVLCIDKQLERIEAVTDIDSFVPLYTTTSANCSQIVLLGSHVDALAIAAGRIHDPDDVSVVDFLLHSTVTYPYTFYRDIKQLPPAAMHTLEHGDVRSEFYWTPDETEPSETFRECVHRLRHTFIHNVERICAGQDTVGVLFSAGEDSRVVAATARQYVITKGLTFADSYNREVRIAERVADKLEIEWEAILRTPTHYLDRREPSFRLTEFHRQFLDAHAVGLLDGWSREWRLLGGHLADVLLKGHYVSQIRIAGIYLRATDRPRHTHECGEWLLCEKAMERRAHHYEITRKYRPRSSGEWSGFWPASHLLSLGHLAANRRLFSTYEPFIDAAIVKLSASAPQAWKVNRKLFHAAMKPLLRDTHSVPHAKGTYPYRGLAVNAPLLLFKACRLRLSSAVSRLTKRPPYNEGPWPAYDALVECSAYYERVTDLASRDFITESPLLWSKVTGSIMAGKAVPRLRALQLLEWADWRSHIA